jgi:integrase/recombinase XerC
VAEATDVVDVPSSVRAVTAKLADEGALASQSLLRFTELIEQFGGHLERHRVESLSGVTPAMAADFVESPCAEGEATLSVRHLRRTAVRMLFRVARDLGLADGDPTLDLELPPRERGMLRALTDDEVALCQWASVSTLEETRLPAAWALAEATARTSELSQITATDVDLEGGRVWLRGGTFVEPRWGTLSSWGRGWVDRRMRALADDHHPLTYDGNGSAQSRQAAACLSISSTLARAGLTDDPGLRPLSVTAWAGWQILDDSGRIEVVAQRLGMRSLDRTARLIGFDWRAAAQK